MIPTIGRIVHYTINEGTAAQINKRRQDARVSNIAQENTGAVVHVGNTAAAGDVYPLLITRVWSATHDPGTINGQLFLDGNDSVWVTSAVHGTLPGQYEWPNTAIPATAFLEAK